MQRVLLLDGATLNLAGELPGSADVKEVLSLVASDGATTQMRAIDVFPDPHGGLRFSVFFYLGDFIISRSVKQLSIVICDSQNQEIPLLISPSATDSANSHRINPIPPLYSAGYQLTSKIDGNKIFINIDEIANADVSISRVELPDVYLGSALAFEIFSSSSIQVKKLILRRHLSVNENMIKKAIARLFKGREVVELRLSDNRWILEPNIKIVQPRFESVTLWDLEWQGTRNGRVFRGRVSEKLSDLLDAPTFDQFPRCTFDLETLLVDIYPYCTHSGFVACRITRTPKQGGS
ncbi:hypothetical protein LBMAG12_05100 [Actinomycetes bacterium]|nr:hypothetical protein LBMAG12_05100 [Actinomycetes bacterium]